MPDVSTDEEKCCGEQPVLRGLILLAAIFLLGLGGVMFATGSAGILDLLRLELQKTAELLKVPANVSDGNLKWVYQVLGATGYATANIGAVAICAASGRRRVHLAAAAATSGAAAGVYLAVLLAAVKPRIGQITQAMEAEQQRYFKAYVATGDERYISQIHLHSGCCGLRKGPADFADWGRRTLPRSCCGQISGNCSVASARKLTCSQAVQDLAGADGLMDLSSFVWILGGTCAALSALLVVLLFSAGQDTVELLMDLRQRAQDRWREQRQKVKLENFATLGQQHGALFDASGLSSRDLEMHRVMAQAATDRKKAAAAGWKKMHVQKSLNEQVRQAAPGSPESELAQKIQGEIELERLRLRDQHRQGAAALATSMAAGPSVSRVLPPPNYVSGGGGSGFGGGVNVQQILEEKLKREAEVEKLRMQDLR